MNTHCCNGESQRPTKGFENEGPVHTELKSQGRNNVETHRFQPRIFLTVSVVLQLCDELACVSKRELSLKSRQTSQGASKGEHLGSP